MKEEIEIRIESLKQEIDELNLQFQSELDQFYDQLVGESVLYRLMITFN